MANRATLRAHLPELRRAKIVCIYGNYWRTFRAAVTFEWPNSELVFECDRNAIRQFFRASHDDAQTSKIFWCAPARISVQESRRGYKHRDGMFADERADCARVKRARMKNCANARSGR